MAISEAHVGRQYPPTPPYEVSAAKVAEFARALGEGHSRHFGADAVAPPTFAAVLTGSAWQSMFDDPELGLALRRVIHGDQRFEFTRLLKVGDRVQATLTIDKVRVRAGTEIISSSVVIAGVDGTERCTASATFVHARGTAA